MKCLRDCAEWSFAQVSHGAHCSLLKWLVLLLLLLLRCTESLSTYPSVLTEPFRFLRAKMRGLSRPFIWELFRYLVSLSNLSHHTMPVYISGSAPHLFSLIAVPDISSFSVAVVLITCCRTAYHHLPIRSLCLMCLRIPSLLYTLFPSMSCQLKTTPLYLKYYLGDGRRLQYLSNSHSSEIPQNIGIHLALGYLVSIITMCIVIHLSCKPEWVRTLYDEILIQFLASRRPVMSLRSCANICHYSINMLSYSCWGIHPPIQARIKRAYCITKVLYVERLMRPWVRILEYTEIYRAIIIFTSYSASHWLKYFAITKHTP